MAAAHMGAQAHRLPLDRSPIPSASRRGETVRHAAMPNARENGMDRLSKPPSRAAQVLVVSRQQNFGIDASQFGPGWEIRHHH